MATNLEEVRVRIGVDHSSVDGSLRTVAGKIQGFATGVKNAITSMAGAIGLSLSAGGLLAGFQKLRDHVETISRISEGTGLGAGLTQDIINLAKASGVADGAVEGMLDKFAAGSMAKGKNPSQALMELADRMASIEDPTERARLAVEAFGKSGVKLIPILKDGSAGVKKLADEFGRISTEQMEMINRLDAQLDKFGIKSKVMFANVIDGWDTLIKAFKRSIQNPLEGNVADIVGFEKVGHRVANAITEQIREISDAKRKAEEEEFLKQLDDRDRRAAIELKKVVQHNKELEQRQKEAGKALQQAMPGLTEKHAPEMDAILREQAITDSVKKSNPLFGAMRQQRIDAAKQRLAGTMSEELRKSTQKSPQDQLTEDLMKRMGATINKDGSILVTVKDDGQ